jgi:hypothetical protein
VHRSNSPPQHRSTKKWLQLPLTLLLVPVVLLSAIFLLLRLLVAAPFQAFPEVAKRHRAARLRRAMRKARRLSSWSEVQAVVLAGRSGTLIAARPDPAWSDVDLWWTTDSVTAAAAQAGIRVPGNREFDLGWRNTNSDFDRWCQSRYLDQTSGTAVLLQSTHWQHQERRLNDHIRSLQNTYPLLEHVDVLLWVAASAARAERCSQCGYSLVGLDGKQCPECGHIQPDSACL